MITILRKSKLLGISLLLTSGAVTAAPVHLPANSTSGDDGCSKDNYCIVYQNNTPNRIQFTSSVSLVSNVVTKSGAVKQVPYQSGPMDDSADPGALDDFWTDLVPNKLYVTDFQYTIASINGNPLNNCAVKHDLITQGGTKDVIQFNQVGTDKITCNIIPG